ncbi:MAG: glycosyltransferase family 4 protein [Spirochaetales bacterium]|nr:glycosyltransferase family 4 protein [Spirochaetales bacterium]
MERTGSIVLLSGLPPDGRPSFLRQLECLAAIWRSQGRRIFVGGPVSFDQEADVSAPAGAFPVSMEPQWRLQGCSESAPTFEDLSRSTDARALIALGYPDQFPFLHGVPGCGPGVGLPCFLWSQFSRVPRGALPGSPTYVPLTARTAAFLEMAGCARIGPVVPHGVDTGLFAPVRTTERSPLDRSTGSDAALVIGTVANNSRRKRFDLIVHSFALFAARHPGSRLLIKTNRLVSLDGVDLPALIARRGLEDRVRIIVGEMSGPQMAELYRRMDLYLNLSEWEGFCIPVIEAMACGVPVVSQRMQGPGEILPYADTLAAGGRIREEEGTVLHEADPQAVCAVLTALAGDAVLRAHLSLEGRKAAVSVYDIRRVAALWTALLQETAE